MHGVIILYGMCGMDLNATVLMVCQPSTHKVIDHVMLNTARAVTRYVWDWINSFMKFHKSGNIDDGKYKTAEEAKFKMDIIEGEGWLEWMMEAFNATSLEELAVIKITTNGKGKLMIFSKAIIF